MLILHHESFDAISKWYEILEQYDDYYEQTVIADYKSRRIQQEVFRKPSSQPTIERIQKNDPNQATYRVDDSFLAENFLGGSEQTDINTMKLYNIMMQQSSQFETLTERMENLSLKLNILADEDQDSHPIIDFFK